MRKLIYVPLGILGALLLASVVGFLLGIIPGLRLGLPGWHESGSVILGFIFAFGYISQRRINFGDVNWLTYLIATCGGLGVFMSVWIFGSFTN